MPRYRYALVRYVPNLVRDEAVNVGILVQGLEGPPFGMKFLPRAAAIHKLDPRADETLVRRLEQQLRKATRQDQPFGPFGRPTDPGFIEQLRPEFNGTLQVTPVRGLVADNHRDALNTLYQEFVAEPGARPRPIAFQALAPSRTRSRVWTTFQKRGLVQPGRFEQLFKVEGVHTDWAFDLGRANGQIQLINSIALTADSRETNLGRALVFRGMMDEVRRAHSNTQVAATAVIEGQETSRAGFTESLAIVREVDVETVPLKHIDDFAQTVARQFT